MEENLRDPSQTLYSCGSNCFPYFFPTYEEN